MTACRDDAVGEQFVGLPTSTISPRYITATRSQRNSATDRSWVMNRHENPIDRCRSARRLRMPAPTDVKRRDGLIRYQQLRLEHQGPREAPPLALSA